MKKRLLFLFFIFCALDVVLLAYFLLINKESRNNALKSSIQITASPVNAGLNPVDYLGNSVQITVVPTKEIVPMDKIIPDEKAYNYAEHTFLLKRRGTKNGYIYELVGTVVKLDENTKELFVGQDNLDPRKIKYSSSVPIRLAQNNSTDTVTFIKSNWDDIVEGETEIVLQCVDIYCDKTDQITIINK